MCEHLMVHAPSSSPVVGPAAVPLQPSTPDQPPPSPGPAQHTCGGYVILHVHVLYIIQCTYTPITYHTFIVTASKITVVVPAIDKWKRNGNFFGVYCTVYNMYVQIYMEFIWHSWSMILMLNIAHCQVLQCKYSTFITPHYCMFINPINIHTCIVVKWISLLNYFPCKQFPYNTYMYMHIL